MAQAAAEGAGPWLNSKVCLCEVHLAKTLNRCDAAQWCISHGPGGCNSSVMALWSFRRKGNQA